MSIKLAVVGYHGVMADSSELVYKAICELLFDHPLFGQRATPSFSDFLQSFVPPGYEWCRAYGFDFPPGKLERVLWLTLRKVPMFPGWPVFLCRMRKESRLPIVVISFDRQSRIKRQIGKQLGGRGIGHYIELVMGESQDRAKAISSLCLTFDIKLGDTAYVSSTISGIKQGREAGVMTVGFADDRPVMREALTKAGAHYCVRDHQELGDLLTALAQS